MLKQLITGWIYVWGKLNGRATKPIAMGAVLYCIFAIALASATHSANAPPLLGQKPIALQAAFAHLSIDKQNTTGYIKAMAQDKHGYIWFGGQAGLARYDGYSLEVFTHNATNIHSISHNTITALAIDKADNLWVATGNGLNQYDYETGHFKHYLDSTAQTKYTRFGKTNEILSLLVGKDGTLWIGTNEHGLMSYSSATGVVAYEEHETKLTDTSVYSLTEDKAGHLWLGRNDVSLSKFDPVTKKFIYYPSNAITTEMTAHNEVTSIWIENDTTLWLGSFGGGVQLFNPQTELYSPLSTLLDGVANLDPYIKYLYGSRAGELWIATAKQGIFRYQKNQKKLTQYVHDAESANSIASNNVQIVFEDIAGDLWVGFHPTGIDVIHRGAPYFANFIHSPLNPHSILSNDTISATEGKDGSLWIGTEKGLTRFGAKNTPVQHFKHNPANRADPKALPADAVLSILENSHGEIWVSTWGGGLSRYNQATQTFVHYFLDANKPRSIADDRIWQIYEDKAHTIWLGSERAGLSRYIRESDTFYHYPKDPQTGQVSSCRASRCILEDSEGKFWFGSTHGLHQLNRATGEFTNFRQPDAVHASKGVQWTKVVFEDSQHNLWLGTMGGGLNLFNKKAGTFKAYKIEDGLADNVVTGIQEDNLGFLWISGANGLSRLNTKTMQFKTYNKRHGLPGNLFNRDATVKRANGNLVFGSSEGVTIFNPINIEDNAYVPPVVLTSLSLFNQPVIIGAVNSPLKKVLSETKAFTLNHLQSVFTVEFTALNYRFPEKNQYQYKLEGFDKEWNHVGTQRSATYTNLDAGDYIFRVKAANNEGLWNEAGASVKITILPPLWQSWAAYFLYAFTFVLLMLGFIRSQRQKLNEAQKKIAMERLLNERLRNIDKLKENFLANTSHELRTPLNGIMGLAESISTSYSDLPLEVKQKAKMIYYSGKRLANVVNDILEFSQLANNELVLTLSEIELRPLVVKTLADLQDHINDKSLTIFNNIPENIVVLSNEHRLSQIMHHIIDNAIKFTREGSITITHCQDNAFDSINVTDTGIGISAENLGTIFTAFQQAESSAKRTAEGSGLGLSVIKKLIELHKGEIQVESVEAQGSTFRVRLPRIEDKNTSAQQPHEAVKIEAVKIGAAMIKATMTKTSMSETEKENGTVNALAVNERKPKIHTIYFNSHLYADENCVPNLVDPEKKYTILIVDDDPVNRMVVKAHLRKQHFETLEAIDGDDAIKVLASRSDIDLIVLDVMMPHMTGYEACETLRKQYSLHTLPIIFLTANHQPNEIIKAFLAGGNDFITKPVSGKLLIDKIKTHLSLLEDYRSIEHYNHDKKNLGGSGKDSVALTPPPYLELSVAIANIVAQIFYLIPPTEIIGCWVLNKKNTFIGVDNLPTLPAAGLNNSVAWNKIEGFVTDNDVENINFRLIKGCIAAAKAGRMGDGFIDHRYVQCELIIHNNTILGFIILSGNSATLLDSDYKSLLAQAQNHIATAITKNAKSQLIYTPA